ncbi:MAG TPA: acetyl-CoA carboxylase biotin carboxyl carrier protein [Thermoanaerobaculaceae bacterium]|nr:acetyl-CoA carboxylase biotin carboxyl carrier protein [Thermoanaerobaculaceae bacterium]
MFTYDELVALIRLVSETRVGGVEMEKDGVRVRIDGVPVAPAVELRGGAPLLPPALAAASQLAVAPALLPEAPRPAPSDRAAAAPESDEGLSFVTSPIVGTFYVAPSPDAEPYVRIGDRVHKGQVLCIVEAMKLMNEIEADVSGTVEALYPENASPVEFGERLFAIRPA